MPALPSHRPRPAGRCTPVSAESTRRRRAPSRRVVDQEEPGRRLARVAPSVARAGREEEALPLVDGERVRAVVELVLDVAREHVAAVAVHAPLVARSVWPVLDDGPARAERGGRARPDVRLVVGPADRAEVELPARGHEGILTDSARRRSTSPTS